MGGASVSPDDLDTFEVLTLTSRSITSLWQGLTSRCPVLSALAVRYLSSPPSSSSVERLLSAVKIVYSDRRRRMAKGVDHSVLVCNLC